MAIEVDDMEADDSIDGTEKIPVSDGGEPKSITTAALLAYISASVFPPGSMGRITEDGIQLKNITTGKWHTMYLEGSESAGTLKFATGEEE